MTATVSGHVVGRVADGQRGLGSGGTSTLAASPTTIVADGASTSTITVRLKDSYGNDLTSGGATVVLSTTGGTLSAVTDNGNGTYTANLTASSPGSGTVSGTVNGAPIAATAAVVFTNSDAAPPSLVDGERARGPRSPSATTSRSTRTRLLRPATSRCSRTSRPTRSRA